MTSRKQAKPCGCAVCRILRHCVIPAAPSIEPDPSRMQAGDCQRALIEMWEAMKRDEKQS